MTAAASRSDRAAAAIHSVNRIAGNDAESELVADSRPGVVHGYRDILGGDEADVFPLAPHDHIAPQALFEPKAAGPADHEIVDAPFLLGGRDGAGEIPVMIEGGDENRIAEPISAYQGLHRHVVVVLTVIGDGR